ncbi:traB domain-containing protein-like isoform X1 [Planococcus citri]|uniref:traB domain-containing protein-like isoform X1 n=2 Tax=Planococcus citri TaxID=170843 RepID=UPI0031F8CB1B
MDHIAEANVDQAYDLSASISETTGYNNYSEYLSPDSSISELYSTASTFSDMFFPGEDDSDPDLGEFDKNLPHTVTLLKTQDGARVYVLGTGHFSVESQNDVSKVMQAVKPHILVVELCPDRANVMQMDEETIVKEAKDLSLEKLKSIFKETGVFQGIIYVLLLKLSASLTINHGMAPGGEFRRALKEMVELKKCFLCYGDRPLRITMKRALSKLSWWQSICMFCNLLFSKADISAEEIEKCKQKDILEELMAKLLADYPDLSHVLVNERDIFLTHSLQLAAEKQINIAGRGRVPTRVVGIVGIGHCSGITKLWGKVKPEDIPPLLVIPEPSRSDIIIKRTFKISFVCLGLVGIYYIVPFPKSWSSSVKSACSSLISKISLAVKN